MAPRRLPLTQPIGIFRMPKCLLVMRILVIAAILATVVSAFRSYPHELSYFNELAGGPAQGWKHLLHSNIDWGQGLVELDRTLARHSDWGPVAIAYYGPVSPHTLGSRAAPIEWYRKDLSPLHGFSHVAISVNILHGVEFAASWYARPRDVAPEFEQFFRNQTPIDRLDGSIYVFDAAPFNEHFQREYLTAASLVSADNGPQRDSILSTLPSFGDARDLNKMSISGLCHMLLLFGTADTGLTSPANGNEAFRILTDDRVAIATFGESPFVRTRNGIRYRLSASRADTASDLGESHRDLCLCTFAHLGLSLHEPVSFEVEAYTLKDLLAESIASFALEQAELAWTACAYAHYLPPRCAWTDRFGKTTTFSELSRALTGSNLQGHSCGGLHILQAIFAIVDADREFGILDREARIDAQLFLETAIRKVLRHQRQDGSWDLHWARLASDAVGQGSLMSRLVVTSHMLELIHTMKIDVPLRAVVRSTEWLIVTLRDMTQKGLGISFCPLTHSLRAIQLSLRNPAVLDALVSARLLSPNAEGEKR